MTARRGSIGIDIGGTKTLCALFDDRFRLVESAKFKTRADKGVRHFTRELSDAAESLVEKAHRNRLSLVAVGVGSAGSVDERRTTLRLSPNIPFLKHYPFAARLGRLTRAPVALLNDAQAGLYGEHQLGAAVGAKHVIGVWLGTGIGGALIVDGRLFRGATGHAGNIGQYRLEPLRQLAGSEKHDVLNDMAGRAAIAGAAASLAATQSAPRLLEAVGTDVRKIRSGDLAEAIDKGDTSIRDLVKSRARLVGSVLANMVDFINPEMIVLGGGMTEAMPALVRHEVQAGIDEHATPEARRRLKVVVAKLADHAITAGAAKWALDGLLARAPSTKRQSARRPASAPMAQATARSRA